MRKIAELFIVTKSQVSDTQRGYFPIQHCILLQDIYDLENLANQLTEKVKVMDYNFGRVVDELSPICLQVDELSSTKFTWGTLTNYSNIILQILDTLFYSNSVVVVDPTSDTNLRLAIASVIYLLLPPTLRKKFSFHTGFFGSLSQIKSHLKFSDPQIFDANKHKKIKLQSNDVVSSYKFMTSYVEYIKT